MLQTIGLSNNGLIPDYIYDLPFNQWYMLYGGLVLVFNTVTRYLPVPSPWVWLRPGLSFLE